ncbi:MAG: LytR/AlgR family response regulator transcription factor [Bacillota bacterium]
MCRNIKKFIKENRLEARVSLCTTTPEDVLDYAKVHFNQMNVYILDINLNCETNGLTLGREIRDKDPQAYLIYLTAYIELSMMVFKYKLKAFDFLVKPVSYPELSCCLQALVEDYARISNLPISSEQNSITIKSNYLENKIYLEDIIYIESFGPKLVLHTVNGHLEFYGSLKEMEKKLHEMSDTFYRSHKSFLINTKFIKEINLKEQVVIMSNGDKCLVSRNKKESLKKKSYCLIP